MFPPTAERLLRRKSRSPPRWPAADPIGISIQTNSRVARFEVSCGSFPSQQAARCFLLGSPVSLGAHDVGRACFLIGTWRLCNSYIRQVPFLALDSAP